MAGTSRDDLIRWLHRGQEGRATHMIVVRNAFGCGYYPIFVMPGENAKKIAKKNNRPNMTKLMEVYKLADDWKTQLDQRCCFNY